MSTLLEIHSPVAEVNSLHQSYRKALFSLTEIAKQAGYDFEPFAANAVSRFPTLPPNKQRSIVENLQTNEKIYLSAIENDVNIGDGGLPLAWWAIRDLGLRPCSDMFSHIQNGDVIEVYNLDNIQIFRSFDFLRCTSYSLDEILCYEWPELYDRDEQMTRTMISTVGEMARSRNPKTLLRPFATHILCERFSQRRVKAEIECSLLSPLFDSNKRMAGYLFTFRAISITSEAPT